MYNLDIGVRINVIRDLKQSILDEPVRFLRLKRLNKLMSVRENFRLQFYNNTNLQDPEIKYLLTLESTLFIKFEEELLSKFGSSNTEFQHCLQNIIDTCEQCQFMNNEQIVLQAKQSLLNISEQVQKSPNIMKKYRLSNIKKCQTILDQYSNQNIKNQSSDLEVFTNLDKEELCQ